MRHLHIWNILPFGLRDRLPCLTKKLPFYQAFNHDFPRQTNILWNRSHPICMVIASLRFFETNSHRKNTFLLSADGDNSSSSNILNMHFENAVRMTKQRPFSVSLLFRRFRYLLWICIFPPNFSFCFDKQKQDAHSSYLIPLHPPTVQLSRWNCLFTSKSGNFSTCISICLFLYCERCFIKNC